MPPYSIKKNWLFSLSIRRKINKEKIPQRFVNINITFCNRVKLFFSTLKPVEKLNRLASNQFQVNLKKKINKTKIVHNPEPLA